MVISPRELLGALLFFSLGKGVSNRFTAEMIIAEQENQIVRLWNNLSALNLYVVAGTSTYHFFVQPLDIVFSWARKSPYNKKS